MARRKKTAAERWMDGKPKESEERPENNTDLNEASAKPRYLFPTRERFRLTPRTPAEIDMIAHDLLLWCQQDDSITFSGFCEISGLVNARLYEYAKIHHGLAEAIAIAKQTISNRRECRALENKYSANVVMSLYALYDPEYRAYKKEMSQKEGQGESKIVVVLEKYPETETVPEKRSHDSD
jgi:hypothetical protein